MNARDAILAAIADALRSPAPTRGGASDESASPAAEGAESGPAGAAELASRFRDELALVDGETHFVESAERLPRAVADVVRRLGLSAVIAQSSARASHAASLIDGARIVDSATTMRDVDSADCSILEGRALLADTGSAIVVASTWAERLLPYFPRMCIVVADISDLHSGMTRDALSPFFGPARDRERGEAVIITGPSRTADIEKIIVLGAHGPQNLVVFITGAPGG